MLLFLFGSWKIEVLERKVGYSRIRGWLLFIRLVGMGLFLVRLSFRLKCEVCFGIIVFVFIFELEGVFFDFYGVLRGLFFGF